MGSLRLNCIFLIRTREGICFDEEHLEGWVRLCFRTVVFWNWGSAKVVPLNCHRCQDFRCAKFLGGHVICSSWEWAIADSRWMEISLRWIWWVEMCEGAKDWISELSSSTLILEYLCRCFSQQKIKTCINGELIHPWNSASTHISWAEALDCEMVNWNTLFRPPADETYLDQQWSPFHN